MAHDGSCYALGRRNRSHGRPWARWALCATLSASTISSSKYAYAGISADKAPLNAYPLRSLFRYGDKDVLAMGDDAVVDRIAKAHRAKLRRWLAGATVATPSGPGTTTDLANGSGQYPVRLRDGTTRRYAWSTVRDSLPSSPP